MATYLPAVCVRFEATKPELSITRTILDENGNRRSKFYACDELFVRYEVTNTGSGTTAPVTVREDLSDTMLTTRGAENIEMNVGRLQPGETWTDTARLDNPGEETGQFRNTAVAMTDELKVESNAQGVNFYCPKLDVSIDGPTKEYVDRPITYEVTVKNTSDVPALDTEVDFQRPQGVSQMTVSSQRIERSGNDFLIGRLEPNSQRSFSVTFDRTQPGEIASAVTANAYCADMVKDRVSTQVQGIAAVRLETIDLTDPVKMGETTTYEVRVKNQGTAKAININLSADLPSSMSFVDGQGDTEVTAQNQNINFGTVKDLPAGDMRSWKVKVRADEAGKVRFDLQMTSGANQQPVVEMEPTNVYNPQKPR
jgi:uncharacterized repeat protein (TIGR01451 family)